MSHGRKEHHLAFYILRDAPPALLVASEGFEGSQQQLRKPLLREPQLFAHGDKLDRIHLPCFRDAAW
jgi:hypothetical protein